MPQFTVFRTDTASLDDINCIRAQLDQIGPGPVQFRGGYFDATLNWGTTQADCDQLMAVINAACNDSVRLITAR